jgi:ParB-like chromosome segregation protein Spo0J
MVVATTDTPAETPTDTLADTPAKKKKARNAGAFWIDPHDIIVRTNVRNFELPHNMETLEELADSIAEVGVKVPLIVEIEEAEDGTEQVILFDGERRLRATFRAIEKGHDIKAIRVIPHVGPKTSPAERIANQLLYNAKEELSHLEFGVGYQKLIAFGWTLQEISKKTSYTVQHIQNILKLANSGEGLKNFVATEAISSSEAEKQIRIHGPKKAETIIKKAVTIAKKAGKVKATAKDIAEVTGQRPRNEELEEMLKSAIETISFVAKSTNIDKIHRMAMGFLEEHNLVGDDN